ncbi:hypothetical protein [Legionella shakespearei]|uniref:Uncharacterized protein n=1 Tax=Legionella shakespearei DSM 23087 TaxID=1122169 RepID=A0A0W0YHT2_9GAMM|nr:hypothetical protein [Legionella shakespearei]KTD56509.1 hypothetical protein Lsha_2768 [Legionella shakespearei DSM 23087]
MKTILELLATQGGNGESLIHAIRDKINSLIAVRGFTFQLDNSASREISQGSTFDLRSTVGLATDDIRVKEIRELLANLQQSNILAFEEKQDFDKNTSFFVITHVDEHKLLNADTNALKVSNPIFSPELQHETIRVGAHGIDVSYIRVKSAGNDADLIRHTTLMPSAESSAHVSGINPLLLQSITHFIISGGYLEYITHLVNTCMSLDKATGFQLYLQSSSPLYPIDLRVYLPSGHSEIENIKAKLTGFSLLRNKAIVFEEKMATGTDVVIFIIKELLPARLELYLQQLKQQNNTAEDLSGILTLLQENFPENAIIQDLTVHTGVSVSRPYPHIRCRNFYHETEVYRVIELLTAVLGRPHGQGVWSSDKKPQNNTTLVQPGGYRMYGAAPQELQLIIDVNDFDKAEEKLKESLSVASSFAPR